MLVLVVVASCTPSKDGSLISMALRPTTMNMVALVGTNVKNDGRLSLFVCRRKKNGWIRMYCDIKIPL